MYSKEQLKAQMTAMGLRPDDRVLIHTSFKAVGDVEGGPDGFLDAFCEYLHDGLFLVPTHTWGCVNAAQPVYRVTESIPCIGLIPRTAAFRPDGIRSLHPTHSIWAHGADAEAFVQGEEFCETPGPAGSCWARLGEIGAKILLIGVAHNRNTFIHAVDELADVPNRLREEPWEVTVIDRNGRETHHPFHSHIGGVHEFFGNFEEGLIATGAQTAGRLGDATVRVVDAAACCELVKRVYSRADCDPCAGQMTLPEAWWR